MNITVLGAGAWGTALAIALSSRHDVSLLARDPDQAAAIESARENRRYLPGCPLPPGLLVTALPAVLATSDLLLIAIPVSGLRSAASLIVTQAPAVPFLWACKGLEARTGALPHQVISEAGNASRYGVLSGPSFAEEVARGLPTAITLASTDSGFARDTAQALSNARLRVYASDDLVGVEVAGAVKNVLAIASGISDGLGLGLNARAALITRGLAEIQRFGAALGARRETFMGLAGMGDLILTCTGDLSRNRMVGLALARGRSLDDATASLGHVAEGVGTAREVALRAQSLGVDMPVCDAVWALLEGRLAPRAAVERLMARDPKFE